MSDTTDGTAPPVRLRPWSRIPALRSGLLGPVGDARAFNRDPVAFLRAGRDQAGDLFRFRLLGQRVLFVCGPDLHRAFFRAGEETLSAGAAYPFMKPIFGEGVMFDAEPAERDRQMAYLSPLLAGHMQQGHAALAEEEVERRVATWGDEGEVDLVPAITELVAAVSSRCLLGEEFSTRVGSRSVALYRELASGIRMAGLLHPRLPLPAFRRRDHARRRIAGELQQIIRERRADPRPREDLLNALLTARTPQGGQLPDDLVTGVLIAATFAGQHNTAALAAWAGVVLLDQSDALPRVLAEQHRIMSGGTGMTVEGLHRMEWLEHCVREAERLYPPVFMIFRRAMRPWQAGGFHVPTGTWVVLSPAVSHRLPAVFADPGRCAPERYAGDRHEHLTPHALIGFGGGQHRCTGLAFAHLMVKTIWSVLLRRFHLELLGGPHRPEYATAFVALPSDPCTLRYRLRDLSPPHSPATPGAAPRTPPCPR
ncbi:cytochrome P450 [Streptomyces sp. NPDC020607]|uniref:cytochrome P450 n=1 Tax=Streptomyces sp. NPDC020607 TaxID=3365082 RepID=UPI003789EE6D